MSKIVIDHLARVEGHGGITVEVEGDTVGQVHFDVFEGARLLEPLVRGKRFDEVAPVLSRICAICSVQGPANADARVWPNAAPIVSAKRTIRPMVKLRL